MLDGADIYAVRDVGRYPACLLQQSHVSVHPHQLTPRSVELRNVPTHNRRDPTRVPSPRRLIPPRTLSQWVGQFSTTHQSRRLPPCCDLDVSPPRTLTASSVIAASPSVTPTPYQTDGHVREDPGKLHWSTAARNSDQPTRAARRLSVDTRTVCWGPKLFVEFVRGDYPEGPASRV